MRVNRSPAVIASIVGLTLAQNVSFAQTATWDGGSAGTGTAWNTAANWNPDGVPTSTHIAEFATAGTATNISINAGNGGNQVVGQVLQSGGSARFLATSGGASGSPFTGTFTINGVLDGLDNILVRNTSANNLTIGNFTNNTTTLAFPNAGIIDVQSTGLVTLSARISGAGRIIKTGSGTLSMSSTSSTNTGGLQINGGVATLGSTSSIVTTSGGFVADQVGIANGATFIYTGTVATASPGVNVGLTIGSGGGTISINNASTTFNFSGGVAGVDATSRITKTGAGTLRLTGTHNFAGGLNILEGIVSTAAVAGTGTPSGYVADHLRLDGGTWVYTDTGSTITFGSNRGVTIGANGGGINITSSTETLIINAPIVSEAATSGTFTTVNGGTLRLTGDNTYAGATVVGDGTAAGYLRVNGTHTGAGSYTVLPNGKLGGLGAISLASGAKINVGGLLTPGGSISSTTASIHNIESFDIDGDVALFSGSNVGTLLIEVDPAASIQPIDTLNVTGNLDLTGSTLSLDSDNDDQIISSMVFASYGTLTGTFANVPALFAGRSYVSDPSLVDETTYSIDYNYLGGKQIAIVVPEPASTAAIAGVALVAIRRRTRHA